MHHYSTTTPLPNSLWPLASPCLCPHRDVPSYVDANMKMITYPHQDTTPWEVMSGPASCLSLALPLRVMSLLRLPLHPRRVS